MKIYAFDAQGTTEVSGSLFISGSVTADNFNISDQAVGTPALYSSTNLNLSASNAVVVTSSPLRVASFTDAQTGSFTPQTGDIIYNTTRKAYTVYSGSAWNDLVTEASLPSNKYSVSTVTTTTTASLYNLMLVSSSANIALPSSPSAGDWIKFSNRSAATASLNPDGNKIMGETGSFTIDNANAGFEVVYTDATHGWVLVGIEGTTI
jgi:hypothetical protein